MLSTNYRLRLEKICRSISKAESVPLEDIVWAQKLAKANTTAREMLKQARRVAAADFEEGTLDHFMVSMGLGDPDPSNHKTTFDGADDIVDWFSQERSDDWRQRD